MLGFGLIAASVAVLRRRRRAPARGAHSENLADVAKYSGLADVDPEPLSHVAGEGIDLEGDVRAHETVVEQREKLPT